MTGRSGLGVRRAVLLAVAAALLTSALFVGSGTSPTPADKSLLPSGGAPSASAVPAHGHSAGVRASGLTQSWPARVARTDLPNYNGSLVGNFPSTVADLQVGTPVFLPSIAQVWWPELPVSGPGTPAPPVGPTLVYSTATRSFSGINAAVSNASAFALDASDHRVYAADPLNGSVEVVDISTGAPDAPSIPVGVRPMALAFDPATHELFVVNAGSDNVTVINTTTDRVSVPGVAVGSEPVAAAVDVKDGWVFVANANSTYLSILNASDPSAPVLPTTLADAPVVGLAFSPQTGYLAAVAPSRPYLNVLNGTTHAEVDGVVAVGTGNSAVVVSPTGSTIVVANTTGSTLGSVGASIPFNVSPTHVPVDTAPTVLGVDPTSSAVFAWSSTERTISEVNVSAGTVLHVTPKLSPAPTAMVYDAPQGWLAIADPASSGLEVIDPLTGRSAPISFPVPAAPNALAVDPSGDRLYVALDNSVQSYNTTSGALVASTPLSGANGPLAVDPLSGLLWVGRASLSELYGLNLSTLVPAATSGSIGLVTNESSELAVDLQSNRVFALNASQPGYLRAFNGSTGVFDGPNVFGGTNGSALSFDEADRLLYVAGDTLSALDPSTGDRPVTSVPLGPTALVSSMAYDTANEQLVIHTVAPNGGGWIAIVDGSSAAAADGPLTLMAAGFGGGQVAGDPVSAAGALSGDGFAVVANTDSGTVSLVAAPPELGAFGFVPSVVDVNGTTHGSVDLTGGIGPLAIAYGSLPPGCPSAAVLQLACTPTAAGAFLVGVLITDALGLSANATAPLSVSRLLHVVASVATAAPRLVDVNVSVSFHAAASGGTAGYTYAWNFGDGHSASVATTGHAYSVPGNYTATVQVVDATGASVSSSLFLSVVQGPSADLVAPAGPPTTDAGRSTELLAAITGGSGGGLGTWAFDDGTPNSTGLSTTHTWAHAGVYHVVFSYGDVYGVDTGAAVNITVNSPLAGSFNVSSVPASTVVSTPVTFSATLTGGTPAYTVLWSFGDGSFGSGPEAEHAYAAAGNYTVNVTVTDLVGSSVESTLHVSVASSPTSTGGWTAGTGPALLLGAVVGATLASVVLYLAERTKHRRPRTPPAPYPPPQGPAAR